MLGTAVVLISIAELGRDPMACILPSHADGDLVDNVISRTSRLFRLCYSSWSFLCWVARPSPLPLHLVLRTLVVCSPSWTILGGMVTDRFLPSLRSTLQLTGQIQIQIQIQMQASFLGSEIELGQQICSSKQSGIADADTELTLELDMQVGLGWYLSASCYAAGSCHTGGDSSSTSKVRGTCLRPCWTQHPFYSKRSSGPEWLWWGWSFLVSSIVCFAPTTQPMPK